MAYEAERRIILSNQRVLREVRSRVVSFVVKEYEGLGSWRDADIERFVAKVVPVVQAGQVKTAGLTHAYLTSLSRLAGIKPPPVVALDLAALRGVTAAEVYARPAVATYTALSQGSTLKDAVTLGMERAQSLAAMDLQLAQTHAARSGMERMPVVGYRRVLTGAESCALCNLASTQRYHKRDLMPIHPGCDCTVAPILGDSDPGQVINAGRLEAANAALQESGATSHGVTGRSRDAAQVIIREHGEYGPTLSWADQNFTGPTDL